MCVYRWAFLYLLSKLITCLIVELRFSLRAFVWNYLNAFFSIGISAGCLKCSNMRDKVIIIDAVLSCGQCELSFEVMYAMATAAVWIIFGMGRYSADTLCKCRYIWLWWTRQQTFLHALLQTINELECAAAHARQETTIREMINEMTQLSYYFIIFI